jgi:SpoVK/Ycf46/Vps4 family AAA+-type ATPase
MATAEQIKALLTSYAEGDDSRFLAVSMQLAAHAARKGQQKFADQIRTLVDRAKERRAESRVTHPVPINRASGELAGILAVCYPKTRLSDMVLAGGIKETLQRVISEYRQQHKLRSHGLSARRKLLLVGPPGSGKTMTASALAGELNLPLMSVQLHVVITKFMGETAAKLRLVFDQMAKTRGVYFFDEFDAIGGHRDQPNDVGEIRRVLNSFLQFIEQDDSDSLILAATNHAGMLDRALFRRFDDVVQYDPPTPALARELIENRLAVFGVKKLDWDQVVGAVDCLSYAEIVRACEDAARRSVLDDADGISTCSLLAALNEKRKFHKL